MAKGTIRELVNDRGFGFIWPDDGGEKVFFHFSLLNGVKVQEGQQVEFDSERDAKGQLRAQKLQILGDSYKFLNPYNFVRTIQKGRESGRILGDCPPPPHDRYVGLTGRITCEVEAVTPLFISDSHAVKDDNGHRTFRFFQYDGQPALPASSLRGMVRSIFEMLTNSCFAVFQKDDKWPLEHREAYVPNMVPARVVDIREDSGACLEILDCSVNLRSRISPGAIIVKAGVVKGAYPFRVMENNKPFDPSKSKLPSGAYDGMRVAALVTKEPKLHSSGNFRAFQATMIEPIDKGTLFNLNEDENHFLVFGWLHLTGPNIENKHDERLFFRWDDQKADPPQPEEIPSKYLCKCDRFVVDEYNHHLSDYWDRLKSIVEELGDQRWPGGNTGMPQPSTFVEKNRTLQVGDLVYVQRDNEGQTIRLRPVTIPASL